MASRFLFGDSTRVLSAEPPQLVDQEIVSHDRRNNLRAADVGDFARFRIPAELLERANVRRVTHEQARDECGIRYRGEHLEGLWFPSAHPETGQPRAGGRLRRDCPEMDSQGRPVAKYLSPPDRHVLYFAPGAGSLLKDPSVPVVVVEAEKSVLALTAAAERVGRPFLVIGTGGCWGWKGVTGKNTGPNGERVDEKGPLADWDRLTWEKRDVTILFDANAATNGEVRAGRQALAKELRTRGARVRIAKLPIEPDVNGPDDYLAAHEDRDVFALLNAARPSRRVTSRMGDEAPGDDDRRRGAASQATVLVQLAQNTGAEFFHDGDTAYVRVRVEDHCETYRLRSKPGRAWLSRLFRQAEERVPGAQAVSDAVNALEAEALDGRERQVAVRIARLADRILLDLGDPSWRCVEITGAEWRVVSESAMPFRRPRGLLALPEPQAGGTIEDLRPFVNMATGGDFVLLIALLLAALRGRGPYPIAVLNGEQGSAKSTTTRILKALLDPSTAPLRSAPRNGHDLMIAASNSHLLAFDNLSDLPEWLSDALCRLSTGGGFSTRTLYTDDEEQLFDAVRPLVLNGIPELATRQDLVGRSVFLTLPPIPESARRDESRFWADFEHARPRILGALLDLATMALRCEAAVVLDRLPRMADFARWVVAAEPACPWAPGEFLRVYAGNRDEAIQGAFDGDPLVDFIKARVTPSLPWEGTARELLDELNANTSESVKLQKSWFQRPRQVADQLRRLAPALRHVGLDVDWLPRASHRRCIRILAQDPHSPGSASPASFASLESAAASETDDAGARSTTSASSSASSHSVRQADGYDVPDADDEGEAF